MSIVGQFERVRGHLSQSHLKGRTSGDKSWDLYGPGSLSPSNLPNNQTHEDLSEVSLSYHLGRHLLPVRETALLCVSLFPWTTSFVPTCRLGVEGPCRDSRMKTFWRWFIKGLYCLLLNGLKCTHRNLSRYPPIVFFVSYQSLERRRVILVDLPFQHRKTKVGETKT